MSEHPSREELLENKELLKDIDDLFDPHKKPAYPSVKRLQLINPLY